MASPLRIYYYITSLIATSFSSLLIFIVLKSTPKSMNKYAIVVMDGAINDIILAITDALTEMRFFITLLSTKKLVLERVMSEMLQCKTVGDVLK